MDSIDQKVIETMMPLLDERGKRLFLGVYSIRLGRGGITELSKLTGMSRTTITAGRKEIESDKHEPSKNNENRIRSIGGGRKGVREKYPNIEQVLLSLLDGSVIGNPENPLCWTTKSVRNLEAELSKEGYNISYRTIYTLLEEMHFSLQSNKKYVETGKASPDRDEQFQFINNQAKEYLNERMPVISVDAKKKELVGNYKNTGAEWRPEKQPRKVNDHDFPDPEKGKVAPYGIYDIGANKGFVNVGISSDTGAFAVNSIRSWWESMGKSMYPEANKIMVTADGGGSNGSRNHQWKKCLQDFSDESGLEIHVSHFPPGTSKWNKIEHRLFSQISKNWRGRPLETIEIIINLIASTTTETGLTVNCVLDKNIYEKGVVISRQEMDSLNIVPNEWHGDWNYTILPRNKMVKNTISN